MWCFIRDGAISKDDLWQLENIRLGSRKTDQKNKQMIVSKTAVEKFECLFK